MLASHSVYDDILTLVNSIFLWPRFGLDWSQATKYAGSNECTWNWLRWGDIIPLWGLIKTESKHKLKIVHRRVFISFHQWGSDLHSICYEKKKTYYFYIYIAQVCTLTSRHTSYLSFLVLRLGGWGRRHLNDCTNGPQLLCRRITVTKSSVYSVWSKSKQQIT